MLRAYYGNVMRAVSNLTRAGSEVVVLVGIGGVGVGCVQVRDGYCPPETAQEQRSPGDTWSLTGGPGLAQQSLNGMLRCCFPQL